MSGLSSSIDGVVGQYIDHFQLPQAQQAHRAAYVVGKYQAGASEGDQATVLISSAIEDAGYGVFIYT